MDLKYHKNIFNRAEFTRQSFLPEKPRAEFTITH
jgi:hypothetical protein